LNLFGRANVIEVRVSMDDPLTLQPELFETAENPRRFPARVDDNRRPALLVPQDHAIAPKRSHREMLDDHDEVIAPRKGAAWRRPRGFAMTLTLALGLICCLLGGV
jgi:hypothetical protein